MAWALAIVAFPYLAYAQPAPRPASRAPIGQSVHPGGIGPLVPGYWGAVGTDIVNPRDHAIDAVSAIYFEKHPNLQFSRQTWVPARARLATSIPVLAPKDLPRGIDSAEIQTLLLDRTGKNEVLVKSSTGQMLGDATLSTMHERPLTAVIDDGEDEDGNHAVVAMRLIRNYTRRVSRFSGDFMAPSLENLQGLNHLVLMSDRLAHDSAGVSAIREWIHDGGRLWIMLDQVTPETVNALLGDSFTYHPVDRVGLTKFTIKSTQVGGLVTAGLTQEFKDPVDFVRVLTSQGTVMHTLDGWPASFFFPVGRGRVLCTTVGARAWIRPRTEKDSKVTDVLRDSRYLANDFMTELGYEFMGQPPEPAPLQADDFKSFVAEQIGYRIVSRGTVLLVLGLFCVALVAAGSWLAYQQLLPHLGWLGPLLAVGSATTLVLLGFWSRSAVPATVAIAQLAEISHDADDLQLTGLMALYQQAETSTPLGAVNGGVFEPDVSGQDGKTRRMVYTDLGAWHWENLTLPAGLRTAPFRFSSKLTQPISARATFGPEGLVGTVEPGPFKDLADSLVVLPGQPILSAQLASEGRFSAGPNDILASGEFIGGTILSDERRRRRAVYKKMLEVPESQRDSESEDEPPTLQKAPIRNYPTEPLFLAWASPYDMQFTLPADAQRVGSALLAIPLKFDHPAPGTSFVIPSACVTYESGGTSGAYMNREKRWIAALNKASTTTLRFILPREVQPMTLKQARLTINIDAPGRTLSIFPDRDITQPPLATRSSPVGTVQFNLDQTESLKIDSNGTFLLTIDVGTAQGEVREAIKGSVKNDLAFPVWKIEKVQLEVTGISQ
ncbi:MAG: hypothetical protein V4719_22650 [Planctomycetota bacterium]